MSRIDELRQQIDACRTGGDDLHLPELSGLAEALGQDGVAKNSAVEAAVAREFDRSQRFDRSVIAALQDVSVPTGLLERLLQKTAARAEAGDPGDAVLQVAVSRVVSEPVTSEPAVTPRDQAAVAAPARSKLTRRGWLLRAGSIGVVAAVLLGLAVVMRPTQPRTISQAELAGIIQNWVEQTNTRTRWQSMKPSPPAGFPVGAAWARWQTAWCSIQIAAGESAVAYELRSSGPKARLFVVRTPHRYTVPATPGVLLPGTSGGVKVSAWQPAGGLLYVLFVDRGGPPLEEYLPQRPEA